MSHPQCHLGAGGLRPLRRVAFLGSYPPRLCGIATFTHDLRTAVAEALPDAECLVGACNDRAEGYRYPHEVRFELWEKDFDSYRRAADFLNFNNVEVLSVQHEFGIHGGPAGSHLVTMLKELRMPVVTTLHTLLAEPDAVRRKVMEGIIGHSERLVVMADKGREILVETYGIPESRIDLIPHGIPDVDFLESSHYKGQFGVEGRVVLLTFGLIGPGKGIEHAIRALPEIVARHPDAVYLILGATHPHLLAREGERYRIGLEHLADDCGVKEHVIFYNRFVTKEDLAEFIGAADIYLTPYPGEAQVTSGTLAFVFGAGKAVVSTPYWHARELLADGRGVLVPFADPGAIAAAVCGLLEDPARMERMRREAYQLGRGMTWPSTGRSYVESFQRARADHAITPRSSLGGWTVGRRFPELPPMRLEHLVGMTDETSIFQHAIFNVPNLDEGYCTDDTARAYILCCLLDETGTQTLQDTLATLATRYLSFLAAALDRDSGRFRNFMSHARQWLESVGSEDCQGRALWALGTGVLRSRNEGHRNLAAQLFTCGLPPLASFTSPRAWAFAILGCHEVLLKKPDDRPTVDMQLSLTERLVDLWRACATPDWPWFEPSVTYENARLCQALLLGGQAAGDKDAVEIGLDSLRWLVSIQSAGNGCFRPIGSNGFYQRGGARADFDQQPVEAQAMIAACHEAFHVTRDNFWALEAQRAFQWFLGRNDLGLPLCDFGTGGCSDGLHADRISENQGAESTLAFQLALAEIGRSRHMSVRAITTP